LINSTRIGLTTATVMPMQAPDGAIAPYLFRVEGFQAGASQFKTTALVSKGFVANGGGQKRLEAHFASIGFPKAQLGIGHLIEMFHLMRAADDAWLAPLRPDAVGWKYDDTKATLSYDDKGALLTLHRDGKSLEIRIDPSGHITAK
jgi:hypothetical protein